MVLRLWSSYQNGFDRQFLNKSWVRINKESLNKADAQKATTCKKRESNFKILNQKRGEWVLWNPGGGGPTVLRIFACYYNIVVQHT